MYKSRGLLQNRFLLPIDQDNLVPMASSSLRDEVKAMGTKLRPGMSDVRRPEKIDLRRPVNTSSYTTYG